MFMKKILPFFITFIITTCLYLLAFDAKATDKDWTFDPKTSTLIPKYLGKVKVLNGKAVIGDRELKKGSQIYNNDLVQTSEKSFAVIEMIDLTVVTIGPKTDFKVENWAYRTKNDRDAVFTVLKGQWRALIKSKSKDDDQLKIKTSLVSMGVRGTELMVNVDTNNEKEINQVALLEGAIHLEGDNLPKDLKKDLISGDYTVIEKDTKNSSNEMKLQQKIISPEDMKTYQQFSSPGVLRLLAPIALNSTPSDNHTEEIKAEQNSLMPSTKIKGRKAQSHSLEESLKILNKTREDNLKAK